MNANTQFNPVAPTLQPAQLTAAVADATLPFTATNGVIVTMDAGVITPHAPYPDKTGAAQMKALMEYAVASGGVQ